MAVFFESYFDVDLIWADYALNLVFLLCTVNSGCLLPEVKYQDEDRLIQRKDEKASTAVDGRGDS